MSDQAKRDSEAAGQPAANAVAGLPVSDDPKSTLLARVEHLLDAFWLSAMSGDHKSGELVRRLLAQQADMYGLRGTALTSVDDGDDELAKLRARRAAGA